MDERRDQVAGRVAQALVEEGLLQPERRDRAVEVVATTLDVRPAAGDRGMPKLVEVVAYLGAALVLAAGFLFVLRSWDDLGDVGQVSFLAVVALVLAVAGVLARPGRGGATGPDEVRRRLSGTLLTGASVVAGVAAGIALEVFTDWSFDDVYWPMVLGASVVAAGAAVGYRYSPTAVGLVGMLGGALAVAMDVGGSLAAGPSDETVAVGTMVFGAAVVWLALAELGAFEQRTTALALGVSAAMLGAQVASFADEWSWIGYLISVAIAGAGVWLYVVRVDWPYLAAAVIAVTLVVPEAVSDWTDGSLGAVGGVLVAGITLLVASYAGHRLRKEATD